MLQTLSRFFSIKKLLLVLALLAVIIGGILSGVFTPTGKRKRSRPQSSVLRPFRRHQLHRAAATRRFSRPVVLFTELYREIFSAILLSSFPGRL